jgi:hypothetical protein
MSVDSMTELYTKIRNIVGEVCKAVGESDAVFDHLNSESTFNNWTQHKTTAQIVTELDLSQYIDHTVLKPTTTTEDIIKLCKEAVDNKFYAVCVNGSRVSQANSILKSYRGSNVKVAAVVGFPLGGYNSQFLLY